MIEHLLDLFASTLDDLRKSVADIDEARMADQPAGLTNHPAWTLGHLCTGAGYILRLLDEPDPTASPEDMTKLGPGSKPVGDRSAYPSKADLLARLETLHRLAAAAARVKHAEYFDRPSPENLRKFAPTIGRIVVYLLASHESYHLGQLAQWRRAAGLPRI
jgi:DinB superfamily